MRAMSGPRGEAARRGALMCTDAAREARAALVERGEQQEIKAAEGRVPLRAAGLPWTGAPLSIKESIPPRDLRRNALELCHSLCGALLASTRCCWHNLLGCRQNYTRLYLELELKTDWYLFYF